MKNFKEIENFLLNKFNSCLDTAMKFDLKVEEHYKICGNCKCTSKHPCSCGTAQKLRNLKDMLKE